MKLCSYCGKERPLSDYTKRYESKDGLSYNCRTCRTFKHKNRKVTGKVNESYLSKMTMPQLIRQKEEIEIEIYQRGKNELL